MLGIAAPKDKENPKPIAKRSVKMKGQIKAYNKIKDDMLKESNLCEIQSVVCTKKATGLQHAKRRGVNLLNKKYLIRCCDPCNGYCEQHPQWALDNGFAISVHKIEA